MFKDECGGKSMTEFVGLRPKLYSYKMDNGGTTKRAKGVKRNVIERNITFDEYKMFRHPARDLQIDEYFLQSPPSDLHPGN